MTNTTETEPKMTPLRWATGYSKKFARALPFMPDTMQANLKKALRDIERSEKLSIQAANLETSAGEAFVEARNWLTNFVAIREEEGVNFGDKAL